MVRGIGQRTGSGRRKAEVEKIGVKFLNVSIGPEKASIGCVIDRDEMPLESLEPALCGARLKVTLACDPADVGDPKGQAKMFETAEAKLVSVADVKSLNVRPNRVSFGMQFAREGLDLKNLANLSQRVGTLTAERVGDASSHDEDTDGEGKE